MGQVRRTSNSPSCEHRHLYTIRHCPSGKSSFAGFELMVGRRFTIYDLRPPSQPSRSAPCSRHKDVPHAFRWIGLVKIVYASFENARNILHNGINYKVGFLFVSNGGGDSFFLRHAPTPVRPQVGGNLQSSFGCMSATLTLCPAPADCLRTVISLERIH